MDSLNLHLKHDSFFGDGDSFSNLRLPIFLLALAMVILYQVRQNRKRDALEDGEEETIAMKLAKRAGGKMNAQTRADLAQIDAMEKSLRGMTKNIGNLGGRIEEMDSD